MENNLIHAACHRTLHMPQLILPSLPVVARIFFPIATEQCVVGGNQIYLNFACEFR